MIYRLQIDFINIIKFEGDILSEVKVCIITEGSGKIGFGHITRCSGLYEAFSNKGIHPLFILNSDESTRSLLNEKESLIFDWLKNRQRLLNLIENMDIVIIDSYLADLEIYEKISELVSVPVYLDDDKRIDYPKGIVVNGTIHSKYLDYPETENVEYLLGTDYIPLRKEFVNVPVKKTFKKVESVMITFGGDDLRNMTPKMLEILTEYFPRLIKKVIIGKGFKNINEIEKLESKNTELIYYPEAQGMIDCMLNSDLCISAGGQTLYELARIGLPTIAIAVAKNQINNVNYWKETDFIEYAGFWDDTHLVKKIIQCIEDLQDLNLRECKSKIGQNSVDGMGALRIAEYCIQKLS